MIPTDILLITQDPNLGSVIQESLGAEFQLQVADPSGEIPPAPVALLDMDSIKPQDVSLLRIADTALIGLVPRTMLETFGGFEGMDDWVSSGAGPAELRARLRLALRRKGLLEHNGAIQLEDVVIDQDRYEVRVKGRPVELTYKEFELLRFLASNPGRVFSREVLLDRVWGYDYYGGTRTVDVHIRRIRSKIETGPRQYIKTIRGAGYLFE